jgi:acetolactate synthase-1/2/3 large subunit
MWGNRLPNLSNPNAGVHALGGGIGQGLAMGIGAAVGSAVTTGKKTVMLAGDGGFILNLGELATAVQEQADVVMILMNDQAYGVIKNIQDAVYGGRKHYVQLHTPDYALLSQSIQLGHVRVSNLDDLDAALEQGFGTKGPFLVEIDMLSVGGFKATFAGPPVKVAADKAKA